MTAVETPLYLRMKEHNERDIELLGAAVLNLTTVMLDIKNPVTRWDYTQALWTFLNDLGIPVSEADEALVRNRPRPEGTPADDRPLYLRLLHDESAHLGQTLKPTIFGLNLLQGVMYDENPKLSEDFFAAFERFTVNLGMPTEEQFQQNPELYPGIGNPIEAAEKLGLEVHPVTKSQDDQAA